MTRNQETQMIRPVIKFVVLGVFLMALLTLPVLTQVFAMGMGGGGGGGGGAGAGGAGAGAAGGAGGVGAGAGAAGAGAGGAGAGSAGAGAAGSSGGSYGGGYFYSPSQDSSYAKSLGTKAKKRARRRCRVGADLYGVGAPIIGTVDQETANAGLAHLGEGDLLWRVMVRMRH
jgi:hypothetical protein